jgi:hypothetical protein
LDVDPKDGMATKAPWTIDVYETDKGEKPAWTFIGGLEGRDRAEAIALVKLLEEQGNLLRRPQSGTLGEDSSSCGPSRSASSTCFSRSE